MVNDAGDARGETFPTHFWLACAMHFCAAMAGALHILFPVFLQDHGASRLLIGTYAGAAGAAAVGARLPLGYVLDHIGRRPALLFGGVVNIASWLAFVWIGELGPIAFALNLLNGIAAGSLFATFFTYASDITPPARRAEGIAFFGIFGLLPDGLGPLLGEHLIGAYGYPAYFAAAAAFCAMSLVISWRLPETHHPRAASNGSHAPPALRLRGSGLPSTLAIVLAFGMAMHSIFTFLAPYLSSTGGPSASRFFLAYSATAASIRIVGARLPDRIGLRRVLVPALMTYGVAIACLPLAGSTATLLLIGGACGLGHGYSFPVLTVLAVSQGPAAARGRVVSLVTAMFDLGAMLAGPSLGGIAQTFGYPSMYAAIGSLTVAAAVSGARDTSANPAKSA